MHIRIIDRGRKWPRIANHLDGRECPHCGVGVFGPRAVAKHQADHEDMWQLLEELRKRTGITEEEIGGKWKWTAVVDSEDAGMDAIEEAG
jgi:hypothetical protein